MTGSLEEVLRLDSGLAASSGNVMKDGRKAKIGCIPWISDYRYGMISESNDSDFGVIDEEVKNYPETRRPGLSVPIKVFCALIAIMLALVIVAAGFIYMKNEQKIIEGPDGWTGGPGIQCGWDPTEARKRGCRFEPMMTHWAPAECIFPDFITEYEDAWDNMHADWSWHWDANLTTPITEAEIPFLQSGDYSHIYTNQPHVHSRHCLYCFRKIAYALEHGIEMIDGKCGSAEHIKHCSEFVETRWMKEYVEPTEPTIWKYNLLYHDCVPLRPLR